MLLLNVKSLFFADMCGELIFLPESSSQEAHLRLGSPRGCLTACCMLVCYMLSILQLVNSFEFSVFAWLRMSVLCSLSTFSACDGVTIERSGAWCTCTEQSTKVL